MTSGSAPRAILASPRRWGKAKRRAGRCVWKFHQVCEMTDSCEALSGFEQDCHCKCCKWPRSQATDRIAKHRLVYLLCFCAQVRAVLQGCAQLVPCQGAQSDCRLGLGSALPKVLGEGLVVKSSALHQATICTAVSVCSRAPPARSDARPGLSRYTIVCEPLTYQEGQYSYFKLFSNNRNTETVPLGGSVCWNSDHSDVPAGQHGCGWPGAFAEQFGVT